MRSLLTLKTLTYAPTGGIVAAVATSLPEQLGGVRNWDYRFCWLRDATITLQSLMYSGYMEEARAGGIGCCARSRATPLSYRSCTASRASVGSTNTLPSGFRGTKGIRCASGTPLRISSSWTCTARSWTLCTRRAKLGWNRTSRRGTCKGRSPASWRKLEYPDEGIWEVRGGSRHFAHSKLMAWVAADRAVKAVEQADLEGPVDRWRALRDEIRRDIMSKGFDEKRNTFTQYYGSKELDAALLMMPLVGFLPATDQRIQGTVAAIEEELLEDGFVQRYTQQPGASVDGLPPGEGRSSPARSDAELCPDGASRRGARGV